MDFCLESLGIFLNNGLILLLLYCSWMSWEYSKSGTFFFGVKWVRGGGHEFCIITRIVFTIIVRKVTNKNEDLILTCFSLSFLFTCWLLQVPHDVKYFLSVFHYSPSSKYGMLQQVIVLYLTAKVMARPYRINSTASGHKYAL